MQGFPLPLSGKGGEGKRGGKAPSLKFLPPLLDKERGTKGVRLTKTKGGGLPDKKLGA